MTANYKHKRKVNRKKFRNRLFFLLVLILLLSNLDLLGRALYPFPYRQTATLYADAFGVDANLLAAVMKAESNFDKKAVSDRGARGLMQIMPDTGQWIARQLGESDFNPDMLFEPETSIRMGAWYIADLTKEFYGDAVLVLAAYNGGKGNVHDWLAEHNLIDGKNRVENIPFPETRSYVKKVLLYYKIYSILYREQ